MLYCRIPCAYKNKNLSVRVEESSYNPQYLAIKVLYQGGQTEIVAVDIAEVKLSLKPHIKMNRTHRDYVIWHWVQVGSYDWVSLKRNYGAVWDTNKVPKGALKMRIAVTAGYDGKWLWSNYVLPADWKNGMIYDTRLQIDDIAKESCPPSQCGDAPWK